MRRPEHQYLGLVDSIFGYFEETHQNCVDELASFKQENKELERLMNFYKRNDTVRGFDLVEGVGLELELDYGDLEEFVGE